MWLQPSVHLISAGYQWVLFHSQGYLGIILDRPKMHISAFILSANEVKQEFMLLCRWLVKGIKVMPMYHKSTIHLSEEKKLEGYALMMQLTLYVW